MTKEIPYVITLNAKTGYEIMCKSQHVTKNEVCQNE